MKVVRRRYCATGLVTAAALLLAACGSSGGGEANGQGEIPGDAVSLWVVEDAISAQGSAYELTLGAQPMPTATPGLEVGYVGFGLDAAPLTITNKVVDTATPGFDVDTYLFFDCELLSDAPVSATDSDERIISKAGWEAEPERLIATDGGYCVQRLDPISVDDGLAGGGEVTVDVGVDDLGFVVPNDQQGRIETMLGRPLFVQFGITEESGATFYSERSDLGIAAATGDGIDAQQPASPIEPPTATGSAAGDAPTAIESMDAADMRELIGEGAFDDLMNDENLAELFDLSDFDELEAAATAATPCPTAESAPQRIFDAAPTMCIDSAAHYSAAVTTNVGSFTIELDPAAAPATVNNFVVLSRYGFYNDTPCHRIIKDFMAQCGDPTGTGLGGPGYMFADELPATGYEIGSVAMANVGVDTNGSQWFVVTGEAGASLPPNYSLFGKVTDGLDTAISAMNATGTESGTPQSEVRIESITIATN